MRGVLGRSARLCFNFFWWVAASRQSVIRDPAAGNIRGRLSGLRNAASHTLLMYYPIAAVTRYILHAFSSL